MWRRSQRVITIIATEPVQTTLCQLDRHRSFSTLLVITTLFAQLLATALQDRN
ncbi:hypothetical protein OIU76_010276 [Salix suchowensis]|nr:hypothetical protein OIU76_010276 [Salix suchowensis]